MRQVRVMITERCNLACPYCCNDIPEVANSFEPVSFQEAVDRASEFPVVCVTGGEPLVELSMLLLFLLAIGPPRSDRSVFLYTNGVLLDEKRAKTLEGVVDGLNVGVHTGDAAEVRRLGEIVHPIVPVRIFIEDVKVTREIETLVDKFGMSLRVWTDGECSNEDDLRLKIATR